MAKQYKTGLIITGDASGGIRAIKATEDELGKLNQGFDRGSRQSKRFGSDAARAGQQLTEIDKGAGVAARGLQTLRRAAAPIAGVIAGMFAANTIKSQVDWGDQLQKTNLRIGASTEALSQYNYVAKLSGVEFGQLTTAWQRQTRRIAEAAQGTGVASTALEQLNLNAKDLNQLAPEEQFERIAAAMQNVESSSERVALAQKLWDSEGVKLVQVVNQGTDAIAQMRAEADALGLTISQDTANAMATYNDEMDRLKFAAQGVSQTLAAELVPSMTAGLQATNAFIQQVGGAEAILDTATDAATMLAVVMGGRLAGALVTSTKRMVADTTATIAKARADATATTAARAKAAETLRVAQADQAAASRALANGHAIAIATGNTTLRTKAITQMAAANQRAVAAEAAHTAAINVNSAAMARGTVAAQGMAAATRTGASALALIGGPGGAAIAAGFGLYYFREQLGLTDEKMQGTIDTVESLGPGLIGVFNEIRAGLIEIDASFFDTSAGALEAFSSIVSGSANLINMGLIPIQHALNALDQGFADWINRFANAFESAGAMPFGMANLFGEQVSRMRNMADGLTGGLIEPIGISTAALDSNAQAWRDQADAMRASADEIRGNTIPANNDLIVTYQTLEQWLDEIERGARSAGDSVSSNAPSEATLEAWSKYNDKLRENIAAQRDGGSAIGSANRALDEMGEGVSNVMRGYSIFLAVQEEAFKDSEKAQKAAASTAQQVARSQAQAAQQAARAAEQSAKKQADALQSIQHEMDPLLKDYETYVDRVVVLEKALAEGAITEEAFAKARSWAAEQYTRAATGAEEYEKQTQSLISTYDSHNQKAQQLQTALQQINQMYRAGEIDGQQYTRMIGNVRDEMQQLALDADPAAQEMARAWEEAAKRIDETFADAFTGAFDSFEDFGDQLMDGFKRLLGELAYQATLKPIVVEFTQGMSGMMGGSGLGSSSGGGFGWGNMLKMGQSLYSGITGVGPAIMSGYQAGGISGALNGGAGYYGNMLSSGYNTAAGWLGYGGATAGSQLAVNGGISAAGINSANAVAGGAASSGGMSGALSGAASAWPLAVAMGMYQSGKLYDAGVRPDAGETWNSTQGNTLGQIGNVGPTLMSGLFEGIDGALAPIVGGKFAAILSGSTFHQALWGGINKGLFGGSWETKDGGIELGAQGAELNAQSYQYQRKSGGLFRGSSYRTEYDELDADTHASMQSIYGNAVAGVQGFFSEIGHDVSQAAIDGFSAAREQISVKDRSEEEIDALIQQWFGDTTDALTASLASSAGLGDIGFEQLVGLAEGLTSVNQSFDMLGFKLLDISPMGALAAESLAEVAGGLGNLQTLQNQYFTDYYSQTEQAAVSFSRVYESLGQLTDSIPESTAQFRDLVEAQDRTTDAGRETYVSLLNLAPAFAQVAGSVDDVITSIYQDILGRKPDTGGLEFYISEVESGALTVSEALSQIRDSAEAASVSATGAAGAITNAADALRAQEQLQRQLWQVEGNRDAIRQLEIDRLGELENAEVDNLTAMQRRIWAIEDESAAQQEAERAQQERIRAIEKEASAMARAREQLASFGVGIDNWLANLNGTDAGMGTPADQLAATSAAFEEQYAKAQTGDRDALGSITQYADRFIDAQKGWSASGTQTNATIDRVTGMLEALPERLSPEQFLAEEFRGIIGEQTLSLVDVMDLNGSGTVSALEQSISAEWDAAQLLSGVLNAEMNRLGSTVLTEAQVRKALAPHATDAEIDRLIKELDANGDGIISRQELTNARIGGLATGVANSLAGHFGMLDANLDGKLTFAELRQGLAGIATDEELRAIMRAVDLNGSGVISELEAQVLAGYDQTDLLKAVLTSEMRALGVEQLTAAQVRAALAPHATDDEISRLITRVDANGNGLISRQELTNARLGNLTSGFASAVASEFDRIDIDASGLIDYNEFRRAFSGMATDAELRRVFNKIDSTGSGQISRLDAIRGSSSSASGGIRSIDDFFSRAGNSSWGLRVSLSYHQDVSATRAIGYHVANEIRKMARDGAYVDRFADGGAFVGGVQAFANGGMFTNSIVSSPTLFDMGLMGEAGPEAIVPLSRGDGGRLGVDATGLMRIPDGPLELPMPNVPLPQFPALGSNDVLQVLQDVKRELQESRKENKRLQEENNRHAAAAVAVQQAGFNGQISEAKKSNRALVDMASDARLEGAR